MKIGIPSTIRTNFIDRNMVPVILSFTTLTGGHGLTLRGSYTIPPGRRAIINSIDYSLVNVEEAVITANIHVFTQLVMASGGNHLITNLYHNSGRVIVPAAISITPQQILVAGDFIGMYTEDKSSFGLHEYSGAILISEFDA